MKQAIFWKKADLIVQIIWLSFLTIIAVWNKEIYAVEIGSSLLLVSSLLNKVLFPAKYRAGGRTAIECIVLIIVLIFTLIFLMKVDAESVLVVVVFFIFWILPFMVPLLDIWYVLITARELRYLKAKDFSLK